MEDRTMQPPSLKLPIKLNSKKTLDNSPTTKSADHVDSSSAGVFENQITNDEENPSENNKYQMVVYDPTVNGRVETENSPDPINHQHPFYTRPHPFSDRTPRVLPSVGAFTVQCANCFKWRIIPTKEKYEEIREHIIENPFFCETGREWRPDMSCDAPPDITQDGSRLWAIDKPSIAQAPPGWQRLLRIRGEGSSKFGDVYYVAPTGKSLRSMVEIQRYLNEHPVYIEQGVNLSQFSFQVPKPLQENYVRKRSYLRPAPKNDAGMPVSLQSSEVLPIAWVSSDVNTDLQLSGPQYPESPGLTPENRPAKKKKTPSKRRINGDFVYNRNDVIVLD